MKVWTLFAISALAPCIVYTFVLINTGYVELCSAVGLLVISLVVSKQTFGPRWQYRAHLARWGQQPGWNLWLPILPRQLFSCRLIFHPLRRFSNPWVGNQQQRSALDQDNWGAVHFGGDEYTVERGGILLGSLGHHLVTQLLTISGMLCQWIAWVAREPPLTFDSRFFATINWQIIIIIITTGGRLLGPETD